MKHSRLLLTILLPAILNCGSQSEHPSVGAQENRSTQRAENIKDIWTVSSKQCDRVDIPVLPHESYRMDAGFFARVEELSKTDTSICYVVYGYDRIVSSFEFGKSYQETAVLRPSHSKKQCWALQDGNRVGDPISTVIEKFGPEDLNAILVLTSTTAMVNLTGFRECLTGVLHLELKKK